MVHKKVLMQMIIIREELDNVLLFFYVKIKPEREAVQMFSDEVREKILCKEELQKLDLVTLSLVIHAIEEVLEEADNEQSVSSAYDE